MDKMMKVFVTMLFAGMLFSSSAWAGTKIEAEVVVGTSSAYGALQSARNSPDTKQFIGCEVFASTSPASPQWVSCSARNKVGRSKSCWSNDHDLVEVATAVSYHSYIYFSVDTAVPWMCRAISIRNTSMYP